MSVAAYYTKIVEMLQGRTPELQGTPPERLDWAGSGAVLDLYKKTSGSERGEIIHAMEQILEEHKQPSLIMAQVIHIAASLDIAQLEPHIEKLKSIADSLEE